jgi:protein SCO1/2
VVLAVHPDQRTIVIRHEAISNFMAAMTMPFKVKFAAALAGRQRGDQITFQLYVTATESWVDQLAKIGSVALPPMPAGDPPDEAETSRANRRGSFGRPTFLAPAGGSPAGAGEPSAPPAPRPPRPTLRDFHFTNELGEPVSLNDFRGQALALTFFYTRCPLPEFCPRLSKNFEEASHQLAALPNGPTNWHFLSVSFDTGFDSPAMLKAYGENYHYDPAHWSFLTGPPDKIGELVRQSGVTCDPDGATFNHNFRTLIVDAGGHLQMVFMTGGDLSDEIVSEMLKAAAVTDRPGPPENKSENQ